MTQLYKDELAQLYDVAVPDWPGEIAFYQRLIHQVPSTHPAVLEIACGTGRVAVQLARPEVSLVGIDLSDEMLTFASLRLRRHPVFSGCRLTCDPSSYLEPSI